MRSNQIPTILCLALFATATVPAYACHQEGRFGERCARIARASDTDEIYLVYQESLTEPETTRILFSKSDDFGETWATPVVLSGKGNHHRPRMAGDTAGGVYAVWYDVDRGAILWAHSQDRGVTWSGQAVVAASEEPSFFVNPDIAAHRDAAAARPTDARTFRRAMTCSLPAGGGS